MRKIYSSFIAILTAVICVSSVSCNASNTARPALLSGDDMDFLRQLTADVVNASRVYPSQSVGKSPANTTGETLIRPGGRKAYPSFWVRDFAMSLESGFISQKEQKHAIMLVADKQQPKDWTTPSDGFVPAGAIVDHITFDGNAIFFPGTYDPQKQGGKFGKRATLDDQFFFVHMVWYYVKKTPDKEILSQKINGQTLLERLDIAFAVPPCNPQTQIVYTTSESRGVNFGFFDSIIQTGDLFFCSLLKYRAAVELKELHQMTGNAAKASDYTKIAECIRSNIPKVFPARKGLFAASTETSSQPDVWGSAFAVYIGALPDEQSAAVCKALTEAYRSGTLAYQGQIRQVLTCDDFSSLTAWQSTVNSKPKNQYQNGAYWATPTGWVCYAIARVDLPLAKQLAAEYLSQLRTDDFRKGLDFGSPWECVHPTKNYKRNAVYMTSVTCPLAAFTRMQTDGLLP